MPSIYNHSTVNGSNLHIIGNHNVINGNNNSVVGNHNVVRGNKTTLTGNHNKVHGHENKVAGNHNSIEGNNNTSSGVSNHMAGNNNVTKKSDAVHVTNFSTHGFAGDGMQVMTNYGNYAHTLHGTQTTNVTSSGGGRVVIDRIVNAGQINMGGDGMCVTVGRGIGVQSGGGGSTIVNDFSGRGMSTVVIDAGGDSDSSSSSSDDSSSESKKYHRERPSGGDNNNNRARDRSEQPPSKKIIYPKPWPEEPGRGIEGIEKKCKVCKTASAIVIAWPCTHTCLCVRCTLEVKPIACIACKKNVTEFKMIEPETE